MKRFMPTFAVALVALFHFARSAPAAVFNCPAGDVACLIAAINTANGDPDADTILLEAGAYTLTAVDNADPGGPNGLPLITSRIIIQGVGATSTIIERDPLLGLMEPRFRILLVDRPGSLTLENLTIRRGIAFTPASGAGVLNYGTVKIENATIANNYSERSGAGIANHGTLSLTRSHVERNRGGGIDNSAFALLSINGSTIRGNPSPFRGAGIDNGSGGTVFITNSTIDSNSTSSVGLRGEGGGISNLGTMTIINSSIVRNESVGGGAGIANLGVVRLNNGTIAGNVSGGAGGGIQNTGGGTVELQNTILAGNTASGEGPDCLAVRDPITSLGNNLVGDTSDCTIALLASDLTGDPGLGSFQDDGLPGNGHFPLLETSQAVDAGDPASCLSTDQLGQPRVDGDGDGSVICDIGAIELPPGPIDVSDLLDLAPLVTAFHAGPVPGGPAGRFSIKATFTNKSSTPIHDPVFKVTELSGGNLLLNADGGAGQAGARLTPDVGPDAVLSPDESFTTEFVIGLQARARFKFFVDVIGVPEP